MNKLCILLVLVLLLTGCQKQSAVQRSDVSAPQASASSAAQASSPATEAPEENPTATHDPLTDRPSGKVIEINEKVFIALINDIYLNPDDYVGKTLKYEGLYQSEVWSYVDYEEEIHYVIRYGPGCCGSDGNAGFEIVWDGEYPEQDEWVEVVGELTKYEFDEYFYLQVKLDSLTVKEERGRETLSL